MSRPRRVARATVASGLASGLLLASAVVAAAAAPREAPLPEWARPLVAAPLPSGPFIGPADAWLVLRNQIELGVAPSGGLRRTWRLVVAPLGEAGGRFQVVIPYDEETQALVGPSAWIADRGSARAVDMTRAGRDVPAWPSPFVHARRLSLVTTEPLSPRQRLVLTYQVVDRVALPGEDVISLLGSWPVARLEIRPEPGAGIELAFVEPADEGSRLTTAGPVTREGLPSIARVLPFNSTWVPAPLQSLPFVHARVRTAPASWDVLAERLADLYAQVLEGDAERWRASVPEDLQETVSARERVLRIAGFVQGLSYRNVAWGTGAYEPEPPSETLRTCSGDCKAKVVLLAALLQDAGTPCVPVVVSPPEQYLDELPVPTVAAFSHVVAALKLPPDEAAPAELLDGPGAGWTLFDPTSGILPLGMPPPRLEGTKALWLSSSGGGLFTIRMREPHASVERVAVSVTLDADGGAAFRMVLEGPLPALAGIDAAHLQFEDPARFRERWAQALRHATPGLTVSEATWTALDHATRRPPRLVVAGRVPSALQSLGGGLHALACPTALAGSGLGMGSARPQPPVAPSAELRDVVPEAWLPQPCCSPFDEAHEATIDVRLPEGWSIRAGPGAVDIDAPWERVEARPGPPWTLAFALRRGRFPRGSQTQRFADAGAALSLLRRPFVVQEPAPPAADDAGPPR